MLSALNLYRSKTPREIIEGVKDSVDAFVGDAPQFDDITMMGLKYDGPEQRYETANLTIDAKTENLDQVLAFAEEQLAKAECPIKAQTQIGVAVEEIFVNIALYAYAPETGKADITIDIGKNPKEAVITFRDKGVEFNPLEKEDPDVTQSAEDRQIGGLGIYIVKKTMDEVTYAREGDENVLRIRKEF